MSIKFLNHCWHLPHISPTQKLVLISLADQANDAGVCWPAVANIQNRTNLSRRTVQYAIKALSEKGYLVIHRRGNNSNWYDLSPVFNFSASEPEPDPTPTPTLPKPEPAPEPEPRSAPDATDAPQGATKAPRGRNKCTLEAQQQHPNHNEPPKNHQRTNNKAASAANKKSNTSTSTKKLDYQPWLELGELDEQVLADLLAMRRQKRAPLSQTVINNAAKQLAEAIAATGLDLSTILAEWVAAGWTGFRADWLITRIQPNAFTSTTITQEDIHCTEWAKNLDIDAYSLPANHPMHPANHGKNEVEW